jgi:hypothetical protein
MDGSTARKGNEQLLRALTTRAIEACRIARIACLDLERKQLSPRLKIPLAAPPTREDVETAVLRVAPRDLGLFFNLTCLKSSGVLAACTFRSSPSCPWRAATVAFFASPLLFSGTFSSFCNKRMFFTTSKQPTRTFNSRKVDHSSTLTAKVIVTDMIDLLKRTMEDFSSLLITTRHVYMYEEHRYAKSMLHRTQTVQTHPSSRQYSKLKRPRIGPLPTLTHCGT